MAHPKWFEEVKASRQLPSPTGVALRVLRLAEMEETSAAELARSLQADPALAGRVLKYANSSLFAPGRPVVALLDAVTYLGMRCVQRLVLGLSVVAQYRRSSCRRFNHPQYWSRSLATAIAARMLSKAGRRGEGDELFVCGLLSEVGALALATVHPQAYDRVLEQGEGKPWLERLRLEQRTFAMDEVDLTAAMIQDWGLPERYVQVILGLKQREEGDALPGAGGAEEGEGQEEGPAADRALVWLLRVARQVAVYCTGEVERPRQASALLGLAGVVGLTAPALASVVERVGKEWQEWAQQVGAPAGEVPCVLEAAREVPVPPLALLRPGEEVEADAGPGRLRVLVADGDAAGLRKLAADVQAAGYEAITARDGREALHTALDAWPEVLVLDSHLPGMDGLALCRLLRKTRPGQEVYVILLTAAGSDEEVVAAFDAGADDYCARPWSPRVLAARLRAGERAVRLQRTLEQEKEEAQQAAARLRVEQRQLEGQLRQAQKMDAIGRLAGGVAHDFNNLLTVINGYAQLLGVRLGAAGDGCREMLQQIARAGERATSLTRQLLTFSRQAVIEPKVLDLNAVIGESEKMLRRLIGEHIQLEAVPGAGLWRVRSDPGQVDQVLLNLAVNARDAMPQGGKLTIRTGNVEVTEGDVGLRPDARPGPHVVLTVSDTGCGMAADVQAHIFEPFYTTKEPGKGTGLGLATVYGIVKQSGGHIRVESEVGRGTTFAIYLPRAAEEEVAEAAPQRAALGGGSGRLLLVEDEEPVRSFIGAALRGAGYQVLEATDGRDALALLERESVPVQLVVTDVVMPHMGGPQLVEVLRRREPGIKVVYVSGYADDTVLRAGALDGGAAFVQKPFTPGALTHKVRELLGA